MADSRAVRTAGSATGGAARHPGTTRLEKTIRWLFAGWVLVLFLSRFFYVAESADQGDTLWIVAGWITAALGWSLLSWIWPSTQFQLGWLGVGVALLFGGEAISTLQIVLGSGDQRTAINLAWEALGVVIAWFILHQHCGSFQFRRELLAALLATGVTSAGLGLYQHYVDFPQMAAKYAPLFDRLKQADPNKAASIRKELASENIPTDGPALILFEKRLRDSREPLGFFALANSFGGFLAVSLILAVSVVASRIRAGNRWSGKQLTLWIVVFLVLGWALLLTKSRTAWLGTGAGLVLLMLLSGRTLLTVRGLQYCVGVGAFLLFFGWGLTMFGGLDRQVLTEAPKSLQYRLQYWQATTRMIADQLLFGVGPGQFRSHYLRYKLPEASEEIADPHNLFLDVFASGGIASFLGLVLIGVVLFKDLGTEPETEAPVSGANPQWGILLASIAAVAWLLLLLSGADDRLLVVLPVAMGLFWGLCRVLDGIQAETSLLRAGWHAAAFTLMCHLCGAGGIGMPAISLLLLTLIDCGTVHRPGLQNSMRGKVDIRWLPLSAFSLLLLCGLITTGIRPISITQAALMSGDRLVTKGQLSAAELEYRKGEQADGWSSESTRRRAELSYRQAAADHFRSNESFLNAVQLLNDAKRRNPTYFRDDVRLAEWWMERWRASQNSKDAAQAVAALERAWDRYPTNAILMSELAIACQRAGKLAQAREVAEKALRQEAINREWGHVDRYLEESRKRELESLIGETAS
ncbi:O-antigen ligase family protein [Schlesneria sp. T3-172]|uniref:O-antigen ligase family protein n=1 Tax=Schlesneria sphaerica TaxID=3373610 RepID=UPI0037C68011